MTQIIYVDDRNRILGITSAELGIEVDTEINCSYALGEDGIPRYKYIDREVIERTEAEIDADRVEPIEQPTQLDMIEAQVMYTAIMTDTLIEGV